MDRISGAGYQTIGGKRFWQDINLGAGQQGTDFVALWGDGVQESIIGVAEAVGIAPADAAPGSPDLQLFQAIARIAGGNVTTVTASGALTADNAGLVLVTASSAAIAITMPAVNSASGHPLTFEFVRLDATGEAVTMSPAGSDAVLSASGTTLSTPPLIKGVPLRLLGDGASHWRLGTPAFAMPVGGSASGTSVSSYSATASFTAPTDGVVLLNFNAGASGGASSITALTLGGSGYTVTASLLAGIGSWSIGSATLAVAAGAAVAITMNATASTTGNITVGGVGVFIPAP